MQLCKHYNRVKANINDTICQAPQQQLPSVEQQQRREALWETYTC